MDKLRLNQLYFILLSLLIHNCVGPPTKNKENGTKDTSNHENKADLDDFGLEYNRYLSEVVNALESDPDFRKKLESANEADFRNGKIAAELEYVNHRVRTKLDELKRTELERLRDLVHKAEELEKNEIGPNHVNAEHVDHANPHTFESADLHKLITQVRQDLAETDRRRKDEFKEYELQKKYEQEEKIKIMDEEHKKQYLHELEEQKKKHQQHDPLHHPGSRAQLEEVWEKEDHMDQQKFNPRTFFLLHDINGDGYWDEDEVKALFVKELDKLYQAGVPEDDMREREEEMERMREHVFKESDTNGDRLISYDEFLEQTKKQEFNRDDGWESIDSQPQYSQHEYEEFERRRNEEIQRLIDQGLLHPQAPGMMPPPHPGYAVHPGQYQQQYPHPGAGHPNQVPPQQYGQNVYHNPQGVPQHPQAVPQHPQAVPQGVPQHHPQAVPQHPQQMSQGVPQHHPQAVPAQAHYAQQGQYGVPQYGGQPQTGHQQQPPQAHGQAPQQNSAPPHPNSVPVNQKQAPQYANQVPVGQQNVPQHQQQGLGNQNQGQPIANQQPQQPPQQRYQPDPNQVPSQQVPSPNQQAPAPNQQYQQIPQSQQPAQSQQPPAAFQPASVEQNNQIHADPNKVPNTIPKH